MKKMGWGRSGKIEVEHIPNVRVWHAKAHWYKFEKEVYGVEYQRLNACLYQLFRQMLQPGLADARQQFLARMPHHI
jgi:hypothetical protein